MEKNCTLGNCEVDYFSFKFKNPCSVGTRLCECARTQWKSFNHYNHVVPELGFTTNISANATTVELTFRAGGLHHHTPRGGGEEICFCPIFSLILLVFGLAGLLFFLLDLPELTWLPSLRRGEGS